jgi:DNA repair exonuclease SbcCD ATPase subunit
MAEKEIVIEYGGRSYGKAAIQDLLQRVDAMRTSGEEMGKEIASLKRQIGGLKTSNANYRKQVEQLKGLVEHYKALDLEGDHLYEDKIAELDNAKKEIMRLQSVRNDVVPKKNYDELAEKLEIKNAFIEQLQEKAQNLMIDNSKLQDTVNMKESVISELEETIDELSKPWWKKIF